MNQFSSDTLWCTPMDQHQHQHQHQLQPYPFFYHNHNSNSNSNHDEDGESEKSSSIGVRSETESSTTTPMEKEPMFEKALTPSDVGKLNRLVIPKQHAEKYFPLAAATAVEGGGGWLLGFEDELGKSWQFRYSYWNSSQSYVLTKGWSRYVKDKKLDAADVVYFERHRFNPDRFFIGWRRRCASSSVNRWTTAYNNNHNHPPNGMHSQQAYAFEASSQQQISPFPNDIPHALHAPPRTGNHQVRQKLKTGNSRRVRLFGVNLVCEEDEEDPQFSDASSLVSRQTQEGFGSHLAMGPTSYN